MRKSLLISAFAALGLFSNAQTLVGHDHNLRFMQLEKPMVSGHATTTNSRPQARSQRAGASHLHSQKIGSSGNLFTIIEGNCKMIDANTALNAVTFIHRADNVLFPTNDIGQYRYDYSKDGGNTWAINLGPITNNNLLLDGLHNGRYPEGIIYNPLSNTSNIPDSAKFIYSGTWHNSPAAGGSGSWQGELRGSGQLGGGASAFDTHLDQINGGQVAIATGLTQGAPGVFWNLNENFTGTFATGSTQLTVGFIVEKGVWNATTQSVDWTSQIIPQNFVTYINSGSTVSQSASTSWSLAFDPTGQYGWVGCLGDTLGNNGYQPILWRTTDFGTTWQGPYICDLTSLPNVMHNLGKTVAQYAQSPSTANAPSSGIPTTAFDMALTVDVHGIPHMLATVGNQIGGTSPYSIDDAGYDLYDFTLDLSAANAGCVWQALHLQQTGTFAGVFSSDAAPNETLQEHRPQVSRSEDGSKLFFFWTSSDVNYSEQFNTNEDNQQPNLFGKGIDVVNNTATKTINFTVGDSLWGGATIDSAAGVFGGAIMPAVSQHCLVTNTGFNVPVVFSQIDYANNPPATFTGSNVLPAAFWYVNNINFNTSDFTQKLDSTPPVITVNGPDTMYILVNTSYTDSGATAYDCVDGVVNVQTVGTVDVNTGGIYFVNYIATDASGNTDTVTRMVVVSGVPVAQFTWNFPILTYKAQFIDGSTNVPTAWQWRFTSPTNVVTGTTIENPLEVLNENGTWNVCLVASNSVGTSAQTCHTLAVVGVGINEVSFAQNVTLFPNPTKGTATISIEGNTSSDFTVSVTNMLGEAVIAPAKYATGTSHVELNLSSVAGGVYLVKLQSNQASVVKQLTVTK